MSKKHRVSYTNGDGIGPEIMEATLRILDAAGANLDLIEIPMGEKAYLSGNTSGISDNAWADLVSTNTFLKAPITTPQGGGYKSLNVTVRKTLGLYSNVRPCRSFDPFVRTKHPGMDLVIVRENEEDLYAGIEHRQTDEVYQCLKLITRPGTEKIIRYAFEYAVRNGRKKVSCFTKDNIMKMTDGLFHKIFEEIGAEYPNLEKEHWIVDIGSAKLADTPQQFDVIVLPNLYGDILSDVTAQIAGSVGMAGSANIGDTFAMFEAIHGSAPRRAGQNVANPSGLINGAVLMMNHLGEPQVAENILNAWLKTIEDGIHTYDVYDPNTSRQKVGTREFASAIIERLGAQPQKLKPASFPKEKSEPFKVSLKTRPEAQKNLVGVDIFVHEKLRNPDRIAERVKPALNGDGLKLDMITNRGVKVWPKGRPETFCTDHWRLRFTIGESQTVQPQSVWKLMSRLSEQGLDIIKTENLYEFDKERGYTLGQGQ